MVEKENCQKTLHHSITPKNISKQRLMRYSCAPRLVGIAFQVLEICSLLFSFKFLSLGSKNRIGWKIHASRGWCQNAYTPIFGGHGFSGFGDKTSFWICPNFPFGLTFGPWAIVHASEKIGLNRMSSKNSCKELISN